MSTSLISSSQTRKRADIYFIGHFEGSSLSHDLIKQEPSFFKNLKYALDQKKFRGKFGEIFSLVAEENKEATEIVAIGLGQKKNFKTECFRKTSGKIVQYSKHCKVAKVRVALESFLSPAVDAVAAAGLLTEIDILGLYDFDRYKSKKEAVKPVRPAFEALIAKSSQIKQAQKNVDWSRAVAEGALIARDLINEPGNVMNPQSLAQEARRIAAEKKLFCKILGASEMKRLKMGGVLSVNQGSKTPAAFIILEHGRSHKGKGTICLVGKGVTFDTGGISIKPAKDMEKMKYDMSGAAAVIGMLAAASDLKLPHHIVGIAPAVENMVAEDPQRPGDIIRISNGKTVEVLNTDAEGRLILADALAYTKNYKPKAIIDLATLTGMCAATFGDQCCAILGNDEKLIAKIRKAGDDCGERCWQLPMYPGYAEQIKGYHSDLVNIGGPYGGTITAAMFLKEFVPEKTSWAHLDIAGMAWANSSRYDCVKGATGFGVKLLAQVLSNW